MKTLRRFAGDDRQEDCAEFLELLVADAWQGKGLWRSAGGLRLDGPILGFDGDLSYYLEPAANDAPAAKSKSALELDIEAKTERFLELLGKEPLDELRAVAPTLSAFFDRLGHGPVEGARVLQLIKEAEETVDRNELMKVHTLVSAELATAFANLMMRAMSEQS